MRCDLKKAIIIMFETGGDCTAALDLIRYLAYNSLHAQTHIRPLGIWNHDSIISLHLISRVKA